MYLKKMSIILGFCLLLVISTGCTIGESPSEKMYDHLEETVKLESGFAEVQKPLVETEQKEQKLFDEMLGLSMKEIDKIKKLADEAAELSKSREELIQKEKESIDSAYEEFKSVNSLVEELEEENVQSKAEELVDTMNKRYDSYNKLNKAYEEALKMDQELYNMMKNEELTIDELKGYTEKLNQQYEEVLKFQDEFNQLTDQYNEKKKAFYKEAGFNTTDKKVS